MADQEEKKAKKPAKGKDESQAAKAPKAAKAEGKKADGKKAEAGKPEGEKGKKPAKADKAASAPAEAVAPPPPPAPEDGIRRGGTQEADGAIRLQECHAGAR